MHLSLQAPQMPQTLAWWQIATGIIGIPTALVGLFYTTRLSQKTRLESRKLQLEITEKERSAQSGNQAETVARSDEMSTSVQLSSTRTQEYTVRFIIYWLAVQGWSLVTLLLEPIMAGIMSATIAKMRRYGIDFSQHWEYMTAISAFSLIPRLGDVLLFLILGVPLLSDIAHSLGAKNKFLLFLGK